MLMHASLAVTLAGTPLGLAAVKYWTRTKFKGTQTLKRHVNPTRIPIEIKESYRWLENLRQSIELLGTPERYVHVADRESDIYELFCLAQDLGKRFLICVQTNRLVEPSQDTPQQDGAHRAFAQRDAAPWVEELRVVIGEDTDDTACLQVKFETIKILPPIGNYKRYSPQPLIYIRALETEPSAGRSPIDWKLVTNLPVTDLAGAIEKLNWYVLRWKVEVFHKVVKSGCRAEDSRLQTAERLVKFLALITVVSWRIFFVSMSARAKPDAPPDTVLTAGEIRALDCMGAVRSKPRLRCRTLSEYLLQIGMVGGYLARNHDPPLGNMVVWRGLTRLHDLAIGITIGND